MRKLILRCLALLVVATLGAQNNSSNIALGTYIPNQFESMPNSARQILETKLGQMITNNGINDMSYNSRFIITPNISVISKDVLPTAPPRVALNLDITLYIGDGIAGTLYSSKSFNVKGVGSNETKAYISAIQNMNVNSDQVHKFVTEGKEKIIAFFDSNCELIQKEAQTLAVQNRYEEALGMLINIPVQSSCYDKAASSLKSMYQKAVDRDCELRLNEATAIWASSQDLDAANGAALVLSGVEPSASCYSGVKTLFSKIENRAKELTDRPWEYKLKVLEARDRKSVV